MIVEPTPNQAKVLTSKSLNRVLMAGRGFGKSFLIVLSLILDDKQWEGKSENRVYWIVSPTLKQARTTTWLDLLRFMPKSAIKKVSYTDMSLETKWGTVYAHRSAQDPDNLRGPYLDMVAFDEQAQIPEFVFDEIVFPMLAKRGSMVEGSGKALFSGTPKGRGDFYQLYLKGQGGDPEWESWRFSSMEGGVFSEREAARARRTMSREAYDQEILAVPSSGGGLMFPQFNEGMLKPRFEILPPEVKDWQREVRLIGAIDHGYGHPCGALIGAVDGDKLYVLDEYKQKERSIKENSAAIQALLDPYRDRFAYWLGDRGMFKNDGGQGGSLDDQYVREGIRPIRRAKDGRTPGHEQVRWMMETGRLVVASHCIELQKEILDYERKDGSEDAEKANDDLVDCLRYMAMELRPQEADKFELIVPGKAPQHRDFFPFD